MEIGYELAVRLDRLFPRGGDLPRLYPKYSAYSPL